MASVLLRSFPSASSITTGSYAPKASWHKRKTQNEHNFLRFSLPSSSHHYKSIEGGSTCQERNKKYVVKATSGQSYEYECQPFDPKCKLDSIKNSLNTFYKFSRPYAFITSALNTTCGSILVLEKLSDISPLFFTGLLETVVATLLMHIYVVGVNQLFDIEIDKINKPYLPLASGEYSFGTGLIITTSSLTLSFCLSWILGSWPMFWTLFVLFVLGTAYSMNAPLLRWKNSAALATICISMQGTLPQLGFFLHMQTHVYKRPAILPRPLTFAIAFLSFFFIIIAQLKDLPDTEGDRTFGVQSLTVLLGSKPVFWTCVSLLEIAYGVAIFVGVTSPYLWSKIITGLGHAILALVLWYHAKHVDLKSNASTSSFYGFIWKLVCAEYFLIPFVR